MPLSLLCWCWPRKPNQLLTASWKIGQLKSSCSSIQPFRKGSLDLDMVELDHEIVGLYEHCLWTLGTCMLVMGYGNMLSEQIQPQIIPAFWECTNSINWKLRHYSRFFFIHFLFEIHGGEMKDFESAFHRFSSLTFSVWIQWRIIIFFSWECLHRNKSLTCLL